MCTWWDVLKPNIKLQLWASVRIHCKLEKAGFFLSWWHHKSCEKSQWGPQADFFAHRISNASFDELHSFTREQSYLSPRADLVLHAYTSIKPFTQSVCFWKQGVICSLVRGYSCLLLPTGVQALCRNVSKVFRLYISVISSAIQTHSSIQKHQTLLCRHQNY